MLSFDLIINKIGSSAVRRYCVKKRPTDLSVFVFDKDLAVLKNWAGGNRVSAEQALAGFLYDAVPDIAEAVRDLGYAPEKAL